MPQADTLSNALPNDINEAWVSVASPSVELGRRFLIQQTPRPSDNGHEILHATASVEQDLPEVNAEPLYSADHVSRPYNDQEAVQHGWKVLSVKCGEVPSRHRGPSGVCVRSTFLTSF